MFVPLSSVAVHACQKPIALTQCCSSFHCYHFAVYLRLSSQIPTVATVAFCKMWKCPEIWYCQQSWGIFFPELSVVNQG